MKFIIQIFQVFYSVYAFSIFILCMLIAFPLVLIAASFGISGGNFIYRICNVWANTWYFLIAVKHIEIYESSHQKNQQFIFVANHISYMDIPALVACLHQPYRVLGKYEMVKVPIFGLIYRAAVILVDRRVAERRAKSVRALKAALKKGISIFIFPEGTFNETDKPLKDFFDGAFRLAIETQTNIKPIIFADTLERLHYKSLLSLTPGISRTIYLEEINVQQLTMKDLPDLKKIVYKKMESALLNYRLNKKS